MRLPILDSGQGFFGQPRIFLFRVDSDHCRSTRQCRETVSTTCPCHFH